MFNVRVKFDNNGLADNRTYTYGCRFANVTVGDRVIVDSPHHGYTAVTVVETGHELKSGKKPQKEVVCTIDDREYKQRLTDKKRLDEIQDAIGEKRRKTESEMQEIMLDQLLNNDPEYQALKAEKVLLETGQAHVRTGHFRKDGTHDDMVDAIQRGLLAGYTVRNLTAEEAAEIFGMHGMPL